MTKLLILLMAPLILSGCTTTWTLDKICRTKGGVMIYREGLSPQWLCIKAEVIP